MLLKSLKLKDFRQFKGEQQITFSTDPDRNVTVIMGENGAGKTTLAQAFTWCLYGDTDFADKSVLCKSTALSMAPNSEEKVCVELALEHNGFDYLCIREQRYTRDANGKIKSNNATFKIAYKGKDGQREYVPDLETEIRMKEILPKELSRYFFFDGERIGNMSKEISRGKSSEFAQAVRSLLGLNAFQAALNHLNGKSRASVIKLYNDSYDSKSDSKIAQYTRDIEAYEEQIAKIEERLTAIESEEAIANEKKTELEVEIRANAESETLARERDRLVGELKKMVANKASSEESVLKTFGGKAHSYFAKKLMSDALTQLSQADKIDKGIPDIRDRTIEYLIKRGKCICGADITFGSDAYKHLNDLLAYIPPQSIGTSIAQFVRECELRTNNAETLFEDITTSYGFVRTFESNYAELQSKVEQIDKQLENLKNVGELQARLSTYRRALQQLADEKRTLTERLGGLKREKTRCETERNELSLKDDNNRKIEVYKAYAQYMYDTLNQLYAEKEKETREQLEKTVNEIFKSIYNGGFSLSIDDRYNIQIVVNEFEGVDSDVETSTAQSISVIFAFIAGVIKMARQSQNPENEMLVSEPYPLVMDAPLSAFDKTRIRTVCDALPSVAEQVIIFIKDTDGEIAETYMGNKVGSRYEFDKLNEFETNLVTR